MIALVTTHDLSYICSASVPLSEPGLSVQQAEADLVALEARETALEARLLGVQTELADVRAERERIKIYLEMSKRYGSPNPPEPAQTTSRRPYINGEGETKLIVNDSPPSAETLSEACHGKSIPDAAIALIRLAGRPLSEDEIVDGLRRGGVTLVSESPAVNVRFALLRKRKETGAVKVTNDKLWDVDKSASPEDEPPKQSGFLQNRDRNNHAERSRQGLLAARKRGVKNGPRSKITPEIKEVAESLLAEGVRIGEIAELIGVHAQTFNRWRKLGLVGASKNTNPDPTSSW
jgi:hypothetical protein